MGKNLLSLIYFSWDIYRDYPPQFVFNIKVDIWHPAVGLRCIIPTRHLSQIKTRSISIQDSTNIEITGRQLLLFEIGISLLKYKEMKLTGQLLSWFVTQMGFVYTFWK